MLTIKNSSIYRTNYHFSKFLFSFFLLSETFHFIPLYSVFTDQTTKWILGKKKLQFIGETFSNNFFSYCFFFTLASSTSFFFYASQCFFEFLFSTPLLPFPLTFTILTLTFQYSTMTFQYKPKRKTVRYPGV